MVGENQFKNKYYIKIRKKEKQICISFFFFSALSSFMFTCLYIKLKTKQIILAMVNGNTQ